MSAAPKTPVEKRILERATTFQGIAVIALGLLAAGAAGTKWLSSKADAKTVDHVIERVDEQEARIGIVEALQRAQFRQGEQTQEMLISVLRDHNHLVPPPAPIETPTPMPSSHPRPTSSP